MPELLGRDSELRQLSEAWASAQRGLGNIALVTAEAGGGKTALLQAFTDPLLESGAVLWGECVGGDGGVPFWPWLNIVPSPALAPLLEPSTDEADRFQKFRTACEAILVLGARLVVIDDLHWADGASLRLLEFLAPLVRRSALLLIVASRPNPAPAVEATLGALARRAAVRLDLPPLGATTLSLLLGDNAGVSVSHLATLSGGNPLLATEFVRHLAAGGSPSNIPSSLPALVRAELRRLSPEAQRLAAVASLVDGPIIPERVLAAANAPASAFDDLIATTFVEASPSGFIRWRHDALREAVAASLSVADRQAHEAALASVCAAQGDESGVAVHGCRAAGRWDPAKAHAAALARARNWAARYSPEYAEGYVSLARSVRHLLQVDEREQLATALFEGVLLTQLHRDPGARATLREAAELARSVGDASALATIALNFGLGYEHGGGRDPEVISLLKEALARLPGSEHGTRARLLARLAWQALGPRDVPLRLSYAEESVREARMAEDPGALANALLALCWALATPEDLPARKAAVDEATRAAEDALDIDLQLGALFRQFLTTLELGDLTAARRAAADFDSITERCPLPYHRWNAFLFNATLALIDGDTEKAQAFADQIDPPSTGQPRQAEVMLSALRGHISAHRGGEHEIAGNTALAEDLDRFFGGGWLLRPRVAVDTDLSLARQLLTGALERLLSEPPDEDRLAFLSLLAETAILTGARQECRTIFETLEPFAGRWVVVANGAACRGPVAIYLAATARVAGLVAEAERFRAMALDDLSRNNAPGLHVWLELEPRTDGPAHSSSRLGGLTPREAEVLALVARGHSNQEIADSLVLSIRTVHRHVENVYARLGIHNRAEAALRAVELGLVAPRDVRATPGQ